MASNEKLPSTKGTTMKKLAVTAAIIFAGYTATRLYLEVHAQILVDRFPDLPEQAVRKANAEILKRALRGELQSEMTDEKLDALMRKLVAEQTTTKR